MVVCQKIVCLLFYLFLSFGGEKMRKYPNCPYLQPPVVQWFFCHNTQFNSGGVVCEVRGARRRDPDLLRWAAAARRSWLRGHKLHAALEVRVPPGPHAPRRLCRELRDGCVLRRLGAPHCRPLTTCCCCLINALHTSHWLIFFKYLIKCIFTVYLFDVMILILFCTT